ncbi:MAG: FkbM family methyltransferase, partial [Synergistaceae bacterium]|nr:FkbM family methyltransferase [Synergistaceae bacterium]
MGTHMRGELLKGRWVNICEESANIGGSWQGRNSDGTPNSWDMELVQFVYERLSEKKEPVLVDVGANTGTMSLLAAFLPSLICYAFEPARYAFELLNRNICLNELQSRIITYNLALSAHRGDSFIYIPADGKGSGLATLSSTPLRFSESKKEEISLITLDEWMLEVRPKSVDLLKIDTEGHELFVLQGAQELLERFSPVIVLEYWPDNTAQFGYNPKDIDTFLLKKGYRGYHISKEDKVYVKSKTAYQGTSQCQHSFTVLTIPRSFDG